jgi:hypothetical protein
MARAAIALAGALVALLAALAFKGALIALPAPGAAGPDGFDAPRAAARLARILGDEAPHPVDSEGGDAVRARLVQEMRAVGLEPRETDDFICNAIRGGRNVNCARVRNLIATIGPAEGPHLLLSAHHDSTFAGPGAADAGIGVASLLEIAHLLRGAQLQRPISFLFNDGEEVGLLGARAFVERDPLAARVDALVNLEARGVTGPAIMFETSRPSAPAIAAFAQAARRPVANSLSTDLYRLIPNSTDVAVFEERDWTILNFAVIGEETRYHSPGDDMASLDRASLQHMGDQALALARLYGAGGPREAAGERLYADIAGRMLVVLPSWAGLGLLGLLVAWLGWTAWARGALGRPLLATAAAIAGAGAIGWGGHALVALVRAGEYWRAYPFVSHLAAYASAAAAVLIALALIGRGCERGRLRAAFWLLFAGLGGALAFIAPGGAIYFLLPPLLAAAGLTLGRRSGLDHGGPIETGLLLAAAAALFLTFAPALSLFEQLMSTGPAWPFAPLAALIALPLLIELQPALARIRPAFVAAGAVDLALLGWLAAALVPAYSADRPQRFAVEYVRGPEPGAARWAIANDGAPPPQAALSAAGPWTREELPHSPRRRWAATAPDLPLPAPDVTAMIDQPEGAGRRLRLRIAANGAAAVSLIAPPEAGLLAAGAPESLRAFDPAATDGRFVLRCIGRSCDGAEVDLVTAARGPLALTVIGFHPGLPDAATPILAARPDHARPQYSPDASYAVARRRF